MKFRPALYIPLAVVGIVSLLCAFYLPVNEYVKVLTGLPFVGALFAALFQILRDIAIFDKEMVKQSREHAFVVAATSHMSTVVFDKHVEFAEEYIKEIQNLLKILSREGPSSNWKYGLDYVAPLYEVRKKYRLWISRSIAGKLNVFEGKILNMGASIGLWEATKYKEGANELLDRAYSLFYEIMELEKVQNKDQEEINLKRQEGYISVIEYLQEILGIEKLTRLRDSIISDSEPKVKS
jgi:hypothetical protein